MKDSLFLGVYTAVTATVVLSLARHIRATVTYPCPTLPPLVSRRLPLSLLSQHISTFFRVKMSNQSPQRRHSVEEKLKLGRAGDLEWIWPCPPRWCLRSPGTFAPLSRTSVSLYLPYLRYPPYPPPQSPNDQTSEPRNTTTRRERGDFETYRHDPIGLRDLDVGCTMGCGLHRRGGESE